MNTIEDQPITIYDRLQQLSLELQAEEEAGRDFNKWVLKHPDEAQILNLLDLESKHRIDSGNAHRAGIAELARGLRRELEFDDHLLPYVHELPFRMDEFLARDGVTLPKNELKLLKEVNHGYWARVGYFTPGVRRLRKVG